MKIHKMLSVFAIISLLTSSNLYADGPFIKLGRGLTNVVTSPYEIIYEPMKLDEDNNTAVAWAGGVPKGILFFALRAVTGAYDVATFLIPIPTHYQPIMQPDTLIEGFNELRS